MSHASFSAVLLFGLVAACSSHADARVDPAIPEVPVLRTEEVRSIGSFDDPATAFSSIGKVDVDGRGWVYVQDGFSIRGYDAEGILRFTVGRKGSGPGEFNGISDMGVLGDKLWVVDYSSRRLTLFSTEGQFLSTSPYAAVHVDFPPTPALTGRSRTILGAVAVPYALRPDGSFVSRIFRTGAMEAPPGPAAATDSIVVPRVAFAANGSVLDTIGWERRAPALSRNLVTITFGGLQYPVPPPPDFSPLTAPTVDGHVLVEPGEGREDGPTTFHISRISLTGDTIYDERVSYISREYPTWYLDQLADEASGFAGSTMVKVEETMLLLGLEGGSGIPPEEDRLRVRSRLRSAMEFPRFQPAVSELKVSRDGVVWMRREIVDEDTVSWTIVDRQGGIAGTLALPANLEVRHVDEKQFWASAYDDLGVPWLRLYRIHPTGNPGSTGVGD